MKKPFISILLSTIALTSCTGYDCSKAEIWLGFIGFSPLETDTIILMKYAKSENFPIPLDTVIITPSNTLYSFVGDTLKFVAFSSDIILGSDFDYQISLPKMSKTYKLTKITEEQRTEKWSLSNKGPACGNPLVSYDQDGQFVDARNNYNTIFVNK